MMKKGRHKMSAELNKYYKNLELDKILSLLSEKTSCEDSKQRAKLIIPSSNLEVVTTLLRETFDAHMLIAKFKSPSFTGLNNVNLAVKKASSGATLSMTELLKIADNIHVFNLLRGFKEQFLSLKTAGFQRFFHLRF